MLFCKIEYLYTNVLKFKLASNFIRFITSFVITHLEMISHLFLGFKIFKNKRSHLKSVRIKDYIKSGTFCSYEVIRPITNYIKVIEYTFFFLKYFV